MTPKEEAVLGVKTEAPSRDGCAADSTESFARWLTIWRYSHGYLSLAGYEAAFRAHPEWSQA
jgi:hypothetical protein